MVNEMSGFISTGQMGNFIFRPVIQVPLSSNFPIKMCLHCGIFQGLMILGIPNYEP